MSIFNFFKKQPIKNIRQPPKHKSAAHGTTKKSPSAQKPAPKFATAPKSNKNVSKKIPNGKILQTRDEYLASGKGYKKPGYEHKGNYRKVVVVDSNRKDDLAVVKLTTSKNAKHSLPNYKQGKSKYNALVETIDNENRPIRTGSKFTPTSQSNNLSKKDVIAIKTTSFVNEKSKNINRRKVRTMKDRI